MKIIVLIKEVPDTYGERKLDLETGIANRAVGDRVIDEICERALEVALAHADSNGDAEVVLLSMGPDTVTASLRKGLAMGASSAIHVLDDALHGADLGLTAETLAAAIRRTGFDLVIAGNLSTDGSGGVLPAMIAEHLGVAHATNLNAVEISAAEIRGQRATDLGSMTIAANLPAVVSITEALPDARFASFKGIMAAKKKPFETISLAELGITLDTDANAHSIVTAIEERPARAAGTKIIDEGDAGERLADYLVNARLV